MYFLPSLTASLTNLHLDVTGPINAKIAIIMVGDIFGFSPQVLQGADILANNKYLVLHPDFFDGAPAQPSWFAPNSEDGPAKIQNFFATTASPPAAVARLPTFIAEVTKEKNIEKWGALGLCWGGKVVSLGAGVEGQTVSVVVQAHPAMLDPQDALKISVPFATLASGDEKKEDVEAFGANLKGEKLVEFFADQGHGWMAARADLGDEKVRKGYQQGYQMVINFFEKYLQ